MEYLDENITNNCWDNLLSDITVYAIHQFRLILSLAFRAQFTRQCTATCRQNVIQCLCVIMLSKTGLIHTLFNPASICPEKVLCLLHLLDIALRIKCNDWLLVDMCPQAANHCASF